MRNRSGAQQLVHIGFEFDVDVVFVDNDAVNNQPQVVFVQPAFGKNFVKQFDYRFRHSIDPHHRVGGIRNHCKLIGQSLNATVGFLNQRIVGFLQNLRIVRVARHIPHLLAGKIFQLCPFRINLRLQILRCALPAPGRALLMGEDLLQNAQHGGRIVPHLGNILLQHRIQKICPHMMGGTARQSPHMIRSAGVGFGKVFAAHGKHRAAAIPAEQESGIGVVIFLDPAVIVLGALLQQFLRGSKGAVIHNRLVMIFKDDMLAPVQRHIVAVDLSAVILAFTKRTNVEIVVQHLRNRDDTPLLPRFCFVFLSCGFFPHLFPHSRRGNVAVGQIIGNLFVAVSLDVEPEHRPHHLGGGFVHLKGHLFGVGNHIAVRHRANPFTL